MELIVFPSRLHGTVSVPASKSDFQRACAAALLRNGTTILQNPGTSADDRAALRLAVDLGLDVLLEDPGFLTVQSTGKIRPKTQTVFCGESGLATRLFIPIAALSDAKITFTGKGSLLSRPLHFFYEILPKLGVQVWGNGQTLPLTIQGPLQSRSLVVDGSLSSQFSSGLLFAFAAAGGEVSLEVKDAVSQPYLDMTVATLRAFGKKIIPESNAVYRVFPEIEFMPEPFIYPVESDWSSAAVWVVAAALGMDIGIQGLSLQSRQADRALVDILPQCGLEISMQSGILTIVGMAKNGFSFDLTDAPDLFPVLAVLAFSLPGKSFITGLHRLVHKESNRLLSVADMLREGGIRFQISGNEMTIPGGQTFGPATVSAANDHRIVMAAALSALNARGPVTITGTNAVEKSYPAFFEDLKKLGGTFEEKG